MLSPLDVLPAWLGILAFTLIPATIAVLLHAIFRRYVPARVLIAHHDVAGFLVAVVGVLYAVVLGFIVVTAWSAFDGAQRNADTEASAVAELFVLAGTFPEPDRTQIRRALADYAFEVRDVEWPMLDRGEQDIRARDLGLAAFRAFADMKWHATNITEAVRESVTQTAVFKDFHHLSVARRQRLLDASGGLEPVLYFSLVLGGLFVLAFAFLFGVENAVPQLVMTGLLAGLIGLLIGLIAEFDRPFGSAIRVTPEAWNFVIKNNDMERYRTPPASPAP